MVDSGHTPGQRRRTSPVISPVLRPTLWAALLGAVAAAAMATPAFAEPALPSAVPDTGSRPVAAGDLRLPGTSAGSPAPAVPGAATLPVATGVPTVTLPGVPTNPLLARINSLQEENRRLGDDMLELRQQRDDARGQLATAQRDLTAAQEALVKAEQRADEVATDAFKAAAALPPGQFSRDLHGLSVLRQLSRGEQVDGATTAATGELTRARAAEQLASQALTAAQDRVRRTDGELTGAQTKLRDSDAALVKLRTDNQTQLIQVERQQEAAEQKLGVAYVEGQAATGQVASPQALAAVRYALAQLGDPYLWSAEGPDRFDCSGLMWAAYRSAGYFELPRVARDQYYATRSRTVDRGALLPGDLLFFASGSSWTTVHHVGMYIGGGKMVQAPSTGDVVKISTVRWSGLYAATRVVGAVTGPANALPAIPSGTGADPKPSKPGTPTPGSTPKPGTPTPGTPKPGPPTPGTPKPTPGTPTPGTPTPGTPTPRPGGTSAPIPRPTPSKPAPSTSTPSAPPSTPAEPSTPSAPSTTTAPTGTAESSSAAPTTAQSTGSASTSASSSAPASSGS